MVLDLLNKIQVPDSSQLVAQQNVAIRVFWSRCQPCFTFVAHDLHQSKQRVSPFYRVLFLLPNWSSCCNERNVFGALAQSKQRVSPFCRDFSFFTRRTCFDFLRKERSSLGAKNRVSPFYHDLGFGLVGLIRNFWIVEQLVHLVVEQLLHPISLIQSNFRDILWGRRGDAYTFSHVTSPVSIRTTLRIQ